MKKVLHYLQQVENALMIITFIVMVCTSFAQVVNRNIFKLGIAWFEEVAVYCMIWMALLGTEIGLRDGTQVAVTAVVDKLHGRGKQIVNIIAKILLVIFSVLIFRSSIVMVMKQVATGQTSPALHIPMYIPYAALTVSFGIITFVQGFTLILMIFGLFKPIKEDEEENKQLSENENVTEAVDNNDDSKGGAKK